jgi:hypothetical protein
MIGFSYFPLKKIPKVVWQEQVEKAPFERGCRYGLSNVSLIISYSIFYSESSLPYKNSNWILYVLLSFLFQLWQKTDRLYQVLKLTKMTTFIILRLNFVTKRGCRYGLSNVSLIISYSIFYSESSLPYKNSNWIYLKKTEYSSIINILYVSYLNKSYISVYLISFLTYRSIFL